MKTPALEIELAYRRCEQITRAEAANFYYGIRLLPRFKREAMCAVYAFARRVDDIGDSALQGGADPSRQLAALAAERAMLSTLPDGPAGVGGIGFADGTGLDDPVRIALAHSIANYRLPLDALALLVEGVEFDVRGTRYETFDELVGYCRRVAGAVGRLCLAIFSDGDEPMGAAALADDLGVAMQLTNILRDIREDERLGRVYLPAEDLFRFGFDGAPAAGAPGAPELILFEARRAGEWFDRGLQLTTVLDSRSASCVLAMTGIYRSILDRILEDPTQVLDGRISLTTWQKAWVALHSLATAGTSSNVIAAPG
jgi:phytoene synthase